MVSFPCKWAGTGNHISNCFLPSLVKILIRYVVLVMERNVMLMIGAVSVRMESGKQISSKIGCSEREAKGAESERLFFFFFLFLFLFLFFGFSPSMLVPLTCLFLSFDLAVISAVAASFDSRKVTYATSSLIVSASLFFSSYSVDVC